MADWAIAVPSFLTGVFVTGLGTSLGHFLQRRRYFQEQLMQKYSELVGIAAEEIDRADKVKAILATGDPFGAESDRQRAIDLLQKRETLHRELSRACFQIRMLETDPLLGEHLKQLAGIQPFILPGKWGAGNFDERFDNYQKEIAAFRNCIESILANVLSRKRRLL